jgi:hypothetical protein
MSSTASALAGNLYVDASLASGANDGSTWADAFQGSGDLPVTARSAMARDPIPSPSVRYDPIWYRESAAGYCPRPVGNTWNASAGVVVHG